MNKRKITKGLLESILFYWGYTGSEELGALKFRNWDINKVRLLFDDILDIGVHINEEHLELYSVCKDDTVYIVSPHIMTLDNIAGNVFQNPTRFIDMHNLDTSDTFDMSMMFADNFALEQVDFGDIDTSKVFNISLMFYRCSSIKKIDLSSINLSYVSNITYAFQGCGNLRELNMGNIPMEKWTHATLAFKDCHNLSMSNIKTSGKREDFIEVYNRALR